jgi:glycosyltransferase involved in cell wall biosynthesis
MKYTSKNCPAVSIIVPVYNAGKYLHRCLDSLINQTLSNIEIICIDDSSQDNSREIILDYKAKDNRVIMYVFTKNWGVSAARNKGLELARGKYIGFVDSDDYVDVDFFYNLYHRAIEKGADITCANIKTINTNGTEIYFKHQGTVLPREQLTKFWWSSLFSLGFLKKKKIKFCADLKIGECSFFSIQAAYFANFICCVNTSQYYYCRNNSSATTGTCTEDKVKNLLLALNKTLDFLNITVKNKEYYCNVFNLVFSHYIALESVMPFRDCNDEIFSIYNKLKYKDYLKKIDSREYHTFLERGDWYAFKNWTQNNRRNNMVIPSAEKISNMRSKIKAFKTVSVKKNDYDP